MERKVLISIQHFCKHYDIPISFLHSLHEFDLIEIVNAQEIEYIHEKHVARIEKMIRLHYELNINLEAIDVVHNLLLQIESLHEDIILLRNRLDFYEND